MRALGTTSAVNAQSSRTNACIRLLALNNRQAYQEPIRFRLTLAIRNIIKQASIPGANKVWAKISYYNTNIIKQGSIPVANKV